MTFVMIELSNVLYFGWLLTHMLNMFMTKSKDVEHVDTRFTYTNKEDSLNEPKEYIS